MKSRILFAVAMACAVFACGASGDPRMRGPFPILSTPFNEDGSVDWKSLARGCVFTADGGCKGVIWCQSDDAVDLLTFAEKTNGYEVCVSALEGRDDCSCCLGCNGRTWEEAVRCVRAVEEVAARHPKTHVSIITRPPDFGKTQEDLRVYFEEIAKVAKRPVIIQTCVHSTFGPEYKSPSPEVKMLVDLARRHPGIYGYVKEETNGLQANDRIIEENAAKPVMHTIFSAAGGWQWLYQSRRCGSEGLITERCAYAPLLGYIWRRMEDGDSDGTLTQAYALFRLLIDQRNMPGGLRGYSLYYLQRQGVFRTTLSREYVKGDEKERAAVVAGADRKWKVSDLKLTDLQKAELDKCYDDMMRFIGKEPKAAGKK